MTAYSLYELNEFIRQVVALNFNEAIWLTAEIAQLDISKGNCYISLVQKETDSETILAQSAAIIWSSKYMRLRRKLGQSFDQILQEGMEVKVQVKVDFHERYGFKLLIEDIDLSFTLGKFALQRQQTIERLQSLNLLQQNAQIPLPIVCQRIAVISSENAAGLQDYINQLRQNPYGYNFQNALFPAAVQGVKVLKDILRQLKQIAFRRADFDCVVIIRGGGSKLDLAAFDHFDLCQAAAEFPLPILTGIGHETDESLLDLVVYQSLKTPTAVAEFLVNRNAQFEGKMQGLFQEIRYETQNILHLEQHKIEQSKQSIRLIAQGFIQEQQQKIRYHQINLPNHIKHILQTEKTKLDAYDKIYSLLTPEATLKRGFSIVYKKGKAVSNGKSLQKGDLIENHFMDTIIESEIK